ncbi:MAG: PH domain-containing protein [Oscillospiraceae bacterium]|nr:PH domain-containing protein [Oscillospiraceae bacterium]
MEFKSVSPALLKIWRARLVLVTFLFALLVSLIFNFFTLVWNILTIFWIVLFISLYSFYLPALYSSLKYSILDNTFCVKFGVFFNRNKYIYINNIQYVMSVASPLSRYYGLCSLLVVGAGGVISLYGLLAEEVLELKSILTKEVVLK